MESQKGLPIHHQNEDSHQVIFNEKGIEAGDYYTTSKADITEYNYNDEKKQDSEKEKKTSLYEQTKYSTDEEEDEPPSKLSLFYQKYRKIFLKKNFILFQKSYHVVNIYWVYFRRLCFTSSSIVTKPWNQLIQFVYAPLRPLSPRVRSFLYASLVIVVIVVTVFSLPETENSNRVQRLIALFGLFVFLVGTFATSNNHKAVNLNTVSGAILIQFLLALFVLRSQVGNDIFSWLSNFCKEYLQKAQEAVAFLLSEKIVALNLVAISVFPAVIFFAATVQILYYLGAIQWLLRKSATIFVSLLNISGCEAVVAVASPFLGQSENALLIKPFLPHLTKSEIHQVMTSGFATISGSVLYGYISLGVDPTALLTSCVMSIPCSIAISKLRCPETEESLTKGKVRVPKSVEKLEGIVHAAGVGAATGIQIVLLIAANLIALLALLYAVNTGLTWIGKFITIENLTLQLITGYLLVPVAWLIGADTKDLVTVGQLIATKIWANEFVAYRELTLLPEGTLSNRTILVTTYALCGFANLGSIGIQVGVLTAMAPNKSSEIARTAVSAMISGAISTFVSASMVGMLF